MANNQPDRADALLLAIGRFPVWACVVLAVGSHLFLHALAMRPYLLVTDTGHLTSTLPAMVLEGLFDSLQYLLPLMLLAGVPLVRWIANAGVAAQQPCGTDSPRELDVLVGEGLRMRRVSVAHG